MSFQPPHFDEPDYIDVPSFEPARRGLPRRVLWIMLGVGLFLLFGSGLYMLLAGREPRVEEPEIDFLEAGIYQEAVVGRPQYVNPLLAESSVDTDLAALIFSGLTTLDDYGQPAPDLAESWEISPDGTEYTFYLRQDVTWQDGTPFTSADVAYTMSLLRDADFPGPAALGSFWRTIETYAEDDYTVRFVLTQPLYTFPFETTLGILPAHLLDGTSAQALPSSDFNLNPVGTGPMRWQGIEGGNSGTVTLTPYSGFYDSTRRISRVSSFVFHYYADSTDAFRALGPEVQAVGGLTPSQLNAVIANNQIDVYSARMPAYGAVIFNYTASERLPFFQEDEVRQALALAVNREQVVADVLGTAAAPAYSPILPGSWAFNRGIAPPAYNQGDASILLDEAGWSSNGTVRGQDGVPLSFTLLVSSQGPHRDIGEALAENWREIGVDVRVQALPPAQLLSRLTSSTEDGGRDYDAALLEFSQGGSPNPDPYAFWHPSQIDGGQNYSGINDVSMSEYLEVARRDPNGVRRTENLQLFQQEFLEETAAIILYNPLYHYAVSCQVDGVQIELIGSPADRFRYAAEWQVLPPEQAVTACQ